VRCTALQAIAPHFYTAATLDLRDDPDEWQSVATFAGVDADHLRLLHQVHGRTVVTATGQPWLVPEADAVITDDSDVALVVRVADCAPILIADRRLGVVSAIHAGWRGTMLRIAPAAVAALAGTYGSRVEDLLVAIGPSIGACCAEMGEEVVEAFRAAGHDAPAVQRWFNRETGKRPHLDLWRANREQLEDAGIASRSICMAGLCTRTHHDVFHSYRAAGQAAGRMAAVIRRADGRPPAMS